MFKFNSGKGAIICDNGRVLIAENVKYTKHNQRKIHRLRAGSPYLRKQVCPV